jgi:acyl-coenzyme A synthetase/AMP-(fatty) acid ligase
MRVRGGSMAAGYWQRLEATRRAFRGEWYDSGDQAVEDPDGRYRIVGRADDMLKISGQWVAPADVEAVVAAVPGVRECAVVGRTDANGLTELVVCLAAAEIDRAAIAAALDERCAASLPRDKRPRAIHWTESFPRTATGKLQRFRLREEISARER